MRISLQSMDIPLTFSFFASLCMSYKVLGSQQFLTKPSFEDIGGLLSYQDLHYHPNLYLLILSQKIVWFREWKIDNRKYWRVDYIQICILSLSGRFRDFLRRVILSKFPIQRWCVCIITHADIQYSYPTPAPWFSSA